MAGATLTLPEAFKRAVSAGEQGRWVEAERLCRAIVGADAAGVDAHVDALHLLATVQHRRGRRAEALASYDKALALRPHYFEALNNRGVILLDLKRYEEALASCDLALALQPDDAETLNNRGIALKELKRPHEALACYDRALALRPDYAEAHGNRGNALYELKRYEEALTSYERALAIRPDDADALNHRGNVLKALKRFDAALMSYDRAIAIRPGHALAHYNRGITFHEINRPDEALACFDRALAIAPDYADAMNGRGNSLKELRRLVEAAASYERAIAAEPDHPFAFGGLADCALRLCDWNLQDRLAAEVRRRAVEGSSIIPPLTLIGYSDDEALALAGAKRYVARRIGTAPPPLVHGAVWRNDRIKVAYLSPDFRQHPVGQLTAELFERHDRSRFEVIGISFGPDDRSPLRARLVAGFDRFHDVSTVSDRDVAALLAGLRTDIAVDLAGYTAGHRPEILAHRPAPIAVAYLGYAGTTGADFVDYIIGDRIALPFDRQAFYTERIVHLPDCFMASDTARAIAPDAPSRREAGLPDGMVFCAFNNHAKLAAPVFAVWMRLLRAVGASVLWLSNANDTVAANLRRAAAAHGVDPARLVFAPRMDRFDRHLARHRLADLFLDTLPYNAHTTANDALWAGLPVLTCRGNSLAGRVASSLLDAAGLPELATASLDDYEATALRLATEPALLAGFRARLARNRLDCPLFDSRRFARPIEAAYRTMWESWQRGEAPKSFAVAAM